MPNIAAVVACALLGALAVFQLALIAGAPIGHLAWGGQHRVLPTRLRIGSAVSIVLYALFALVILDRAGIVSFIPWDGFVQVATWVLFGYFVLGIALNLASRSVPERAVMVPAAALLAIATFFVALG
ncbi:MAG TPA: hypothetical protein VIQ78_02690 [Terrimesophilobacter sp.]|uniref:hypothetical protein n=1 Tax=Terrimesophilobacter sp. TaxID=2906435 RepID=UPI002F94D7DB